MIVSLVAALDDRGLLGVGGKLPWTLPEDLKRFRELTWGKPVLMGAGTYRSLPRRPLPGRLNLVWTSGGVDQVPGMFASSDIEELLQTADSLVGPGGEVFVIGGASAYAALLPRADRLHLTRVSGDWLRGRAGAVYWPGDFPPPGWFLVSAVRHSGPGEAHSWSFQEWRRRRGAVSPA